jgi:hypothetical protein
MRALKLMSVNEKLAADFYLAVHRREEKGERLMSAHLKRAKQGVAQVA